MLLAAPYLLAASTFTTLIADGGPGWLNLLVLLCLWNTMKLIIMGPVSSTLLAGVRVREAGAARAEQQAMAELIELKARPTVKTARAHSTNCQERSSTCAPKGTGSATRSLKTRSIRCAAVDPRELERAASIARRDRSCRRAHRRSQSSLRSRADLPSLKRDLNPCALRFRMFRPSDSKVARSVRICTSLRRFRTADSIDLDAAVAGCW